LRILVIGIEFPWPQTNGSSIRSANVVRALASIGEVDFFAFEHKFRDAYDIPPGEPTVRADAVFRPKARAGRRFDLSWLARSKLPRELAARDYAEARRAMSSFARLPYDLTWIHVAGGCWAFGDLISGPMIVNLDDLRDDRLAAELRSGARRLPARSTAPRAQFKANIRHRAWALLMQINIRRWRALQRRIVEAVDAVTVCSQLDYNPARGSYGGGDPQRLYGASRAGRSPRGGGAADHCLPRRDGLRAQCRRRGVLRQPGSPAPATASSRSAGPLSGQRGQAREASRLHRQRHGHGCGARHHF
jgi:hypothetical protein